MTAEIESNNFRIKSNNEYNKMHLFLKKHHGKACKCENNDCKKISLKKFEWALRHGRKYSYNVNDYIQLCVPCHRKYDTTNERRESCSKRMKEQLKNGVRKNPCDRIRPIIDTKTDKIYDSVKYAAEAIGIKRSTLSMMLTGKNKNWTSFIYSQQNPLQ